MREFTYGVYSIELCPYSILMAIYGSTNIWLWLQPLRFVTINYNSSKGDNSQQIITVFINMLQIRRSLQLITYQVISWSKRQLVQQLLKCIGLHLYLLTILVHKLWHQVTILETCSSLVTQMCHIHRLIHLEIQLLNHLQWQSKVGFAWDLA